MCLNLLHNIIVWKLGYCHCFLPTGRMLRSNVFTRTSRIWYRKNRISSCQLKHFHLWWNIRGLRTSFVNWIVFVHVHIHIGNISHHPDSNTRGLKTLTEVWYAKLLIGRHLNTPPQTEGDSRLNQLRYALPPLEVLLLPTHPCNQFPEQIQLDYFRKKGCRAS